MTDNIGIQMKRKDSYDKYKFKNSLVSNSVLQYINCAAFINE